MATGQIFFDILSFEENIMTNHAALLQEIETLPETCVSEVIDFVSWIKQRKLSHIPETMLMSEASLSKDWDTPEEDEAWAAMKILAE